MEHNFTFNSIVELHLVRALLNAIYGNTAKYQALRSIVDFAPALPDIDVYNGVVNLGDLLDRLTDAINKAEEEEKPKYEHRWAIKTCNDEVMQEYDSLEDAFEYYTSCYKADWIEGGFNEGEYSIFDNELQVELTNEAPTFSVEYNWDVNVNVECGGTSIYTEDTPDEVMDTIREEFYRCNDYGTYEYQNGGICYGHVMDALESAEEERRNANAEEERA